MKASDVLREVFYYLNRVAYLILAFLSNKEFHAPLVIVSDELFYLVYAAVFAS